MASEWPPVCGGDDGIERARMERLAYQSHLEPVDRDQRDGVEVAGAAPESRCLRAQPSAQHG